ncbi:hypothetical protein NPIL_533071 [Nephila pilipes]|uniref:Uncharacterized protein n=1 Tax=Nephila pilipes TaxID=299642 RepID=A0A8X6P239_NEPPI|nr:hypothetical protein NPIL_533071 [Nephila pilipes]
MRLASKRIVNKFKHKFEGPYEVMKVENNNVIIWKEGKSITVDVDQVRIYQPRERDEGVVETDGLNGERSREEQVESVNRYYIDLHIIKVKGFLIANLFDQNADKYFGFRVGLNYDQDNSENSSNSHSSKTSG